MARPTVTAHTGQFIPETDIPDSHYHTHQRSRTMKRIMMLALAAAVTLTSAGALHAQGKGKDKDKDRAHDKGRTEVMRHPNNGRRVGPSPYGPGRRVGPWGAGGVLERRVELRLTNPQITRLNAIQRRWDD